MKKIIFSLFTLLLMSLSNGAFAQITPTGAGTQTNPYQITTPDNLIWLSNRVMTDASYNQDSTRGKFFKMLNNIDMVDITNFIPIGGWSSATVNNTSRAFMGTFDGNGYKVMNLTINKPTLSYVGLFGYIGDRSYLYSDIVSFVQNLGVEGSFTGQSYVGGLVGYGNGIISNCFAAGTVTGSAIAGNYIGGLVGQQYYGKISNCHATNTVSGFGYVGGLVGGTSETEISNSFAKNSVSSTSTSYPYVGGLVGNCSNTTINNCYAICSVSGYNYVGGLLGYVLSSTLSNSYAAPVSVSSTQNYRGIVVGYCSTMELINCFYSSHIGFFPSGFTGSGTLGTFTAKTEEELQSPSMIALLNANNYYPFWRADITPNLNGGFPVLAKQLNETVTTTYNINGATGTTPSQITTTKGALVKLPTPTSGGFSNTGKTIAGWNLQANGNGNSYEEGTYFMAKENATLSASWFEGTGTQSNPYKIKTANDMQWIQFIVGKNQSTVGKFYTLMNNIDMSNVTNYEPIGLGVISSSRWSYAGNFDGCGFQFSNLTIHRSTIFDWSVGLFGSTESSSFIKNIGVSGSIKGNSNVGGLVGYNQGYIENCYANISVQGCSNVGGLVGSSSPGNYYNIEINNCHANSVVTSASGATGSFGGLIGQCVGHVVSNCYAKGSISSSGSSVGGLFGSSQTMSIFNCYAICSVSGSSSVGGFAGHLTGGAGHFGSTFNCYAAPISITGGSSTGGFVGSSNEVELINCYSKTGSWNNAYTTAKTEAELKAPAMIALLNNSVHNVIPQWRADISPNVNEGYPILAKEIQTGIVSYNINGGTGTTPSPTIANINGTNITLPDSTGFSRNGYIFAGWNKNSNGTGEQANGTFYVNGNETFYAMWMEGAGSQSNPFKIRTVGDLKALSNIVMKDVWPHNTTKGKFFQQMNDIDMAGITDFIPIGGWESVLFNDQSTAPRAFVGNYEGGNFKVYNLNIIKSLASRQNDYVGLFGYLGNAAYAATINNLGVEGTFCGYNYVGSLAGWGQANINNCYAISTVTGYNQVGGLMGRGVTNYTYNSYAHSTVTGNQYVGGLVGYNYGFIDSCYANTTVLGDSYIGGLVGNMSNYTFPYSARNSYSTGSVNRKWVNSGGYLGGLVGYATGNIKNCYSTCSVTAKGGSTQGNISSIGGLVGDFRGGTIDNCYATGNVNGRVEGSYFCNHVGGLVGYNTGTIYQSYAINEVKGNEYVGGLLGTTQGSIQNSFAKSNVIGSAYVGGLIGSLISAVSVNNCYTVSSVNSGNNSYSGGFLGYQQNGTISNSYAAPIAINYGGVFIGSRTYNSTLTNCYYKQIEGKVGIYYSAGTCTGVPTEKTEAELKAAAMVDFPGSDTTSLNFAQAIPRPWKTDETPNTNFGFPILKTLLAVDFNSNTGSGTMTSQIFAPSEEQPLKANTFTKANHSFLGWATSATGAVVYLNNEIVTISENTTLFAKWLIFSYPINATCGENGTITPIGTTNVNHGSNQVYTITPNEHYNRATVLVNGTNNSTAVTNGTYTFSNVTTNHTIHATFAPKTYTITFNNNTGSGSMTAQVFTYGVAQNINTCTFTKNGHFFNGWNTTANGSGTAYSNGQSVSLIASITLYAQWTTKTPITINETPQSYVYDGTVKSFIVTSTSPIGVTGFSVSYSPSSPLNVGNYNVTITRPEDATYAAFNKTITAGLVISKASITKPIVTGTLTYNGTAQSPNIATNAAYTISGNSQTNAGSYNATVTLVSTTNYQWADATTAPLSLPWSIGTAALQVSGFNISKVYDGNVTVTNWGTLTFVGLLGGQTSTVNFAGVVGSYNNASVGTAKPVSFTGTFAMSGGTAVATNYTVTQPTGLTGIITSIGGTLTVDPIANVTYNGSAHTPILVVKSGVSTLILNIDYTVAYSNNINAGTANVIVTGIGTYAGASGSGTFNILKASITKPTVTSGALTYNGAAQSPTIAANAAYTITGNSQTNAGSYNATVTLVSTTNYQWADGTTAPLSLPWSIGTKALTINGFNITKVYDGNVNVTNWGTLTFAGLIGGQTSTVSTAGVVGSYNNANVGTAKPVSFNGTFAMSSGTALASNYSVTQPTGLTGVITKATYNMSGVTFPNITFCYDGTPKSLAISGTLPSGVSVSYTNNGKTAVGVYTVTANFNGDAVNFNTITPMTATLTIESCLRTITFVNWNGAILQQTQVDFGFMPVYTGATPNKPSDALFNYVFEGWSPVLVPVTQNATYTAQFTANSIFGPACDLLESIETVSGTPNHDGAYLSLGTGTYFVKGMTTMDASDRRIGTRSVRLRGTSLETYSVLQMEFDRTEGVGKVSFDYASYGSHMNGQIFVEYSTNKGENWIRVNTTPIVAPVWNATTGMLKATVTINVGGRVRVRILKASQAGNTTVNVDNLCITNHLDPTAPEYYKITGTVAYVGGATTILNEKEVIEGSNYTYDVSSHRVGDEYFLKDVKVDGVSVGAVTSYIFTNIQAHHIVHSIYELIVHSNCNVWEDVETVTGTPSYTGSNLTMRSGVYFVKGTTTMDANDRKVGNRSVRLRAGSLDTYGVMEMTQFANGVGKVKFNYASYATHANGQLFVEYSTNGTTWTRVNSTAIVVPTWNAITGMLQAEVNVNVAGNVLIRIYKPVQSGNTSVNIDNLCLSPFIAPPPTSPLEIANIEKTTMNVYPNPTNGSITIALSNLNQSIERIDIIDMTGKLVLQVQGSTVQGGTVDMSNFVKGIYFVRVTTEKEVLMSKVVKQ